MQILLTLEKSLQRKKKDKEIQPKDCLDVAE